MAKFILHKKHWYLMVSATDAIGCYENGISSTIIIIEFYFIAINPVIKTQVINQHW